MRACTGISRVCRRLAPWGVAVASMLVATAGSAQPLMDAFVSAYNSNPDLMAQRARLRTVDETVSQAVAGWRPTVRLQGDYGYERTDRRIAGPALQDNLYPRSVGISIVQPIYRGGKTVAATRGAEADVLAERATLTDREQTVLLGTVTAYSDVVRDVATVRLRRNNVGVLGQQLAATNARFRVGEVTQTDVAQSESRLARSQSDLTASQAQAANSRAAYQRVVGQNPAADLREASLIGTVPAAEDQAVAMGIENTPRVVAAKHRISSASYAIDNAIGDLLPTVQLVGTAARTYDAEVRGDRSTSFSLLLRVSVPIYQNGAEYSRVRTAKQVHGQRQNELDSARRQSAEVVIRAFRQLEAARARVDSLGAQVQASQVALDGVRQEAQVGSRTTLDVLNAEQELLDAQVQLVAARRDLVVSHYTLLAETGQLTARQLRLPVQYYDEEKYYKNVRDKWFGLD